MSLSDKHTLSIVGPLSSVLVQETVFICSENINVENAESELRFKHMYHISRAGVLLLKQRRKLFVCILPYLKHIHL